MADYIKSARSLAARAKNKVARSLGPQTHSLSGVSKVRICTIGVSGRMRPKILVHNPTAVLENFSFRDFLEGATGELPECDAVVFDAQFPVTRAIEQAEAKGIPIYALRSVMKAPISVAPEYRKVAASQFLETDEESTKKLDEIGSSQRDRLEYIDAQIASGNRSPDFFGTFRAILDGVLESGDHQTFLLQLRRYLNYMWEGEPFNEEMFNLYNSVFEDIEEKDIQASQSFYLTFAAMLASSGQYDRMRKLLAAAGPKPRLGGYLGLRVALHDIGHARGADISDVNLFRRLQENEKTFSRLVHEANGSVSIVGNGPQEVGKGRGEEIDASGLVVRFNTFSTVYPHSQDYGTKTDVWVRMIPHPYVRFSPDTSGLKHVMLTGANRLYRNYANWDWLRANINVLPALSFSPSRPYIELSKKLESVPTSGLLLAYMLYQEIGPLRADQIYGCSFAETGASDNDTYHYSDPQSGWSKRHAIDREKAFFQTLRRVGDEKTYYTPNVGKGAQSRKPDGVKNASSVTISPTVNRGEDWTASSFISCANNIYTTSKGLVNYAVDGQKWEFLGPKSKPDPSDIVIGFGLRGTGQKALEVGKETKCQTALAEYGLVSGLGVPSETPFKFSVMIDDLGIFFDTTRLSRTEQLIMAGEAKAENLVRARNLIEKLTENNIVKYNNAPFKTFDEGKGKRRILVMDQTSGDLSISLGQCNRYTFDDMLEHALAQPDAHVFLKLHPETVKGVKDANFDIDRLKQRDNLTLIAEPCNAMHLIKQMDDVYVMTSGSGLEALMAGKSVTCFGVPFYAGWGLTNDMQTIANQRTERTLEDIVSAVFLRQTLWFDPVTQQSCTPEQCIDSLLSLLPKNQMALAG